MRTQRYLITFLAAACMTMLLAPVGLAQDFVLELDNLPLVPDAVPANCSTWHELYPAFCTDHHQSDYEDNGDGQVSACDYIHLDGMRYHIDWVGPTYWLDCDVIAEPTNPGSGNPQCEEWEEVYPNPGNLWHVDNWDDNGNGVVDECDFVTITDSAGNTITCHIHKVGLNIRIRDDGTASEKTSWSKFKAMFGM